MAVVLLELTAAEYKLKLEPRRGGSISAFTWRGEDLLRASTQGTMLDTACFPLIPFANRIAGGSFFAGRSQIKLAPNMPGSSHPHPLHGFGWLSEWQVERHEQGLLIVAFTYTGGEWPWPFLARQSFRLAQDGLEIGLQLANRGGGPMPAGLGFHPYFPLDADTMYTGLHKGEWRTGPDGLPLWLDLRAQAADWWHARPVATRCVDTVYAGRNGPLKIFWRSRGYGLVMTPSDNLSFTVVYVPEGADFFCVEPVSHMTDAVNRPGEDTGLRWLDPGEVMSASVKLEAKPLFDSLKSRPDRRPP